YGKKDMEIHKENTEQFAGIEYGDKNFDIEKYFGQMNDPTCSSYIKGPCGDFMEFYLAVDSRGRIEDISYYTEGCGATRTCAAAVCIMALNKTIIDALSISAGEVISKIKGLPEDHKHCAILSVSTLYRAIADYLLLP
nr:iron-sulfur cluster assembly scaffold protein [Candidatus Wallbacteria bacterium]